MQTPRDNNHVPVKMGILCTDGVTPVAIVLDASGQMTTDQVSTISVAATLAKRDENHVATWMGVSSVDHVTPVPIYVNAAGAVLIST